MEEETCKTCYYLVEQVTKVMAPFWCTKQSMEVCGSNKCAKWRTADLEGQKILEKSW